MAYNISILDLNDDCLTLIITELNWCDQTNLKYTCQRFKELVKLHWRLKYKKWSRKNAVGQRAEYAWLIFQLREIVQVLDVDYLSSREMQLLSSTCFPNVYDLTVNISNNNGKLTEYAATKVLSIGFPRLVKLKLQTNMWLDFKTCENLTDLELHPRRCSCTLDFKSLFQQLKLVKFIFSYCERSYIEYTRSDIETIVCCSSLQEVILNESILKTIIEQLKCLPKLRVLGCFAYMSGTSEDYYVFDKIVENFGSNICALNSQYIHTGFPMYTLKYMPNLRKWTMSDLILDQFKATKTQLESIHEWIVFNKKTLATAPSEQHVSRIGEQSFELMEFINDCVNLQTVGFPLDWVTSGYVNLHELHFLFRSRRRVLEVMCIEEDTTKYVSKNLKELKQFQDILNFKFLKQNLGNDLDYEVYKLFTITLLN
ncbi:uncharacterized protein LOC105210297 isoform X1 [Zeugodacus cucurbitae]|uniref:uncharacterized protein LOC105210297 isoform X1 n=1 Tax=Zeugodacus cucurbitae TaxID=28588 RepID=UPI0005968F88|nr:uncharacterized protein LOC105210297 isoform X1 [Zeugodacus cucurbitae]